MLETEQCLYFVFKLLPHVWMMDQLLRKDLYDDSLPVEVLIAGEIDLAHASVAQLLYDLIAPVNGLSHKVICRGADCGNRNVQKTLAVVRLEKRINLALENLVARTSLGDKRIALRARFRQG